MGVFDVIWSKKSNKLGHFDTIITLRAGEVK